MKWRFSQPIEIATIFQFTHIWHSRKIAEKLRFYTDFARAILTLLIRQRNLATIYGESGGGPVRWALRRSLATQ